MDDEYSLIEIKNTRCSKLDNDGWLLRSRVFESHTSAGPLFLLAVVIRM